MCLWSVALKARKSGYRLRTFDMYFFDHFFDILRLVHEFDHFLNGLLAFLLFRIFQTFNFKLPEHFFLLEQRISEI